tara:strand:+ start:87 stop:2378 length:2292 start_codon:yes stop_codon:yes gene_type:complete
MIENLPSTPDFLEDIPREYIVCPNKKKKDVKWNPKGIKQNWSMEQAMYECSSKEHVECKYDLKGTNILVIDIDVNDYSIDDLFEHTDIDSTYVRGNTKGFHVYVEAVDGKKDKNIIDCMKNCVGDYIGSQVFERIDKEWSGTTLHQVTNQMMDKCFDMSKINISVKNVQLEAEQPTAKNEITEIINLIDVKYINEQDSWIKIILALKSIGADKEISHSFSQRTTRTDFDDDGFEALWEQYEKEDITCGKGTLEYYARESDPVAYWEIVNRSKKRPTDAFDIDVMEDLNPKAPKGSCNIELPDNGLQHRLDHIEEYCEVRQKEIRQELQDIMDKAEKEAQYEILWRKIRYFEQYHFKLMHPKCYGRLSYGKLDLSSFKELEHQYGNVFITDGDKQKLFIYKWKQQTKMLTYDTLDFLPPPMICEKHIYNTFNGFDAERLGDQEDADISMFLNHIKVLSGHDAEGTEYIMDYLAHMIQKPGELVKIALLFQSKQGVGKNIFFETLITVLLGKEYLLQTANMDHVIGKWSMINNKIMVILDETSGKDSFQGSGKIKNLITSPFITWEKKLKDPIEIRNFGRYLFFSNAETPISIEVSDRRFCVFRCAEDFCGNTKYFDDMMTAFNYAPQQKALYSFFKNRDISKWNYLNRPITDAYKDIQSVNIPKLALWLEERIYEYKVAVDQEADIEALSEFNGFSSKRWYAQYKKWLTDGGNNYDYHIQSFGRDLMKYKGIKKERKSSGMTYVVDYDTLTEFMIKEKYMGKIE